MPPLFQDNQKIDQYELVDSLANKAQRSHKAMLISQGFNPETGDLETFVEHCERAETTYNISGAKFSALDEDSDTKRKKKRPKFKEQDEHGKKCHKKIPRYIAISMVKTPAPQLGSAKSSRQRLRKSLSIPQRNTSGIPGRRICWKNNLSTKGLSTSSTRS